MITRKTVILYNIIFLCLLYLAIAFIFSLLYIFLEYLKLGLVIDHFSSSSHQRKVIDLFTRTFYFSITTLFTVGYGDMTPFGLSKGVAIIESMIGYVLPYVIVLNYILYNPKGHTTKKR